MNYNFLNRYLQDIRTDDYVDNEVKRTITDEKILEKYKSEYDLKIFLNFFFVFHKLKIDSNFDYRIFRDLSLEEHIRNYYDFVKLNYEKDISLHQIREKITKKFSSKDIDYILENVFFFHKIDDVFYLSPLLFSSNMYDDYSFFNALSFNDKTLALYLDIVDVYEEITYLDIYNENQEIFKRNTRVKKVMSTIFVDKKKSDEYMFYFMLYVLLTILEIRTYSVFRLKELSNDFSDYLYYDKSKIIVINGYLNLLLITSYNDKKDNLKCSFQNMTYTLNDEYFIDNIDDDINITIDELIELEQIEENHENKVVFYIVEDCKLLSKIHSYIYGIDIFLLLYSKCKHNNEKLTLNLYLCLIRYARLRKHSYSYLIHFFEHYLKIYSEEFLDDYINNYAEYIKNNMINLFDKASKILIKTNTIYNSCLKSVNNVISLYIESIKAIKIDENEFIEKNIQRYNILENDFSNYIEKNILNFFEKFETMILIYILIYIDKKAIEAENSLKRIIEINETDVIVNELQKRLNIPKEINKQDILKSDEINEFLKNNIFFSIFFDVDLVLELYKNISKKDREKFETIEKKYYKDIKEMSKKYNKIFNSIE